jgi:hypothetical protein
MFGLGPRALQWLGAGALVTLLGVLVKFVGWTGLLAGYSGSTSPVPDRLVRDITGNTVLRIGIALLGAGALAAVTDPPSSLDLVVAAVVVLAVARLVYRLNTWSPPQST